MSEWQDVEGGPAKWKLQDGFMEIVEDSSSIMTRRAFGDVQLHVEWASPPKVENRGQARGNSGVVFMGRYEVQVLDCFENPIYADGQAAAIYGQYPPLANACLGPGEWQTYDVVFRRPRFNQDESLSEAARLTVFHNGVLVQDAVELWGGTSWLQYTPYAMHADRLPLQLQHHNGDPVRYRNIWVRELQEWIDPGPSATHYSKRAMEVSKEELAHFEGDYQLDWTVIRVRLKGEQLVANFYGDRWFELIPSEDKEFSLRWTASKIVFEVDSDDKVVTMVHHIGGEEERAPKVVDARGLEHGR